MFMHTHMLIHLGELEGAEVKLYSITLTPPPVFPSVSVNIFASWVVQVSQCSVAES